MLRNRQYQGVTGTENADGDGRGMASPKKEFWTLFFSIYTHTQMTNPPLKCDSFLYAGNPCPGYLKKQNKNTEKKSRKPD